MISNNSIASKRLAKTLGRYLAKKRIEAGLSQGSVSRVLGYSSPQFVSNFERGCCFPPMPALKRLMSLYNISGTEMTKVLMTLQATYFSEEFGGAQKRRTKIRA